MGAKKARTWLEGFRKEWQENNKELRETKEEMRKLRNDVQFLKTLRIATDEKKSSEKITSSEEPISKLQNMPKRVKASNVKKLIINKIINSVF
jgi:hypothetical protein